MALSDRTRRKHVVAAQKHLPPGTYVTGYARGFGGAYPPLAVGGVIAALIAASVLLSVLLRGVFFPGVLLIAVLIQAVRPGRGLVVAQQGLALFNHGFWTAKPAGRPLLVPFGSFVAVEQRGSYTRLQVGPERVWVQQSEMVHIGPAVTSAVVGVAVPGNATGPGLGSGLAAAPGSMGVPGWAAASAAPHLPAAAPAQQGIPGAMPGAAPGAMPGSIPEGAGIQLPAGVAPISFGDLDDDSGMPRSPVLPGEQASGEAAAPGAPRGGTPPPPPAPRPPSSGAG